MIRNLIFDVGNVLLRYRWEAMLAEHQIPEKKGYRIANAMFSSAIWNEGLDGGRLTLEEAIQAYRKEFSEEDMEIAAWFLRNNREMVLPIPDTWEKVEKVRKMGYRMYLLSNYSRELFENHTAEAPFPDWMDGGVISYQVFCTKPDPKIYQILLSRYDLKAEECCFFDDRPENVEEAIRQGIHAFPVTSEEKMLEYMDQILEAPFGEFSISEGV